MHQETTAGHVADQLPRPGDVADHLAELWPGDESPGRAHQSAHRAPGFEQRVEDVAADETSRPGEKDGVGHRIRCPTRVSDAARRVWRSEPVVAITAVGS